MVGEDARGFDADDGAARDRLRGWGLFGLEGVADGFEDEGGPLFESVAICMYLADKYPEGGLAPAPGTRERGEYYQWCLFVPGTLESPVITLGMHTQFLPEAARQPALADQAREQLRPILQVLARRLEGRDFLVGPRFSVADVVVGATLVWTQRMGMLADFPGLGAYTGRLMERPAARRAYAD